MPPTVSINLCCYNSEKYLKETLESIVIQTYKDWELVIINDGSTDSTEIIVKKYIDQGYPITYCWQENHGLGFSRNEALKRSQGEYIAFIDHDDIWLPEKLEKQISLFQKDDRVGLVYCDGYYFGEKGDRSRFYAKRDVPVGKVFRELFARYFLVMPAVMLRRESLTSFNHWFDERFNIIEESDLFLRIAHDWTVDYVDEPLAKYRIHSCNLGFSSRGQWAHEMELMIEKYQKIYKHFDEDFQGEIDIVRADIEYIKAMECWAQGNGLSARNILRRYVRNNKKYFLIYLLSNFPYSIFKRLFEMKRLYVM